MEIYTTIYIVAGIIIFLGILAIGIRIVRPVEEGLVERFGKYKRTAEQGFHWIIPIVDKMVKVNITENMVDVEKQKIITKDSLNADVDAVVYFKVKDPMRAIYRADEYQTQVTNLAKTTLRNVIGKMTLNAANKERGAINKQLQQALDKQTSDWGIDILRVELQRIDPPADVQESMNEVVKAEKTKVAATDYATAEETKADGLKRAEIKKAGGVKEGLILRAEGEAKAKVTVATAEAEKIKLVNVSIQKFFKKEAQTFKALETFKKSFEKGTKYVVDPKSNMVNVMTDMIGTPIPLPKK